MPAETMPKQLSLNAGGATVDTAVIGGLRWAAGTQDLDGEVKKGSDVELTVRCRVTDVTATDKYDAHGNIAETIRSHGLRVDELVGIEVLDAQAYRKRNEPTDNGTEPDAE